MSTAPTLQPYHASYLSPCLEHATVADAMHPGILTIAPDASLTSVAQLMAAHRVHSVAVMGVALDGPAGEIVWGIVSDLDVVQAGAVGGAEPMAADLAKTSALTVRSSDALRDAAGLMVEHGLHHLVVVSAETRQPVGILSSLDVVGVVAWGHR